MLAHRLARHLFADYEADLSGRSVSLKAAVRDAGLLESALGVPAQPYYATLTDKAGALLRSMVKDHAFVDGNKRLGLATTFAFLVVNQRVLLCTNDEMVAFAVDLAASVPSMGWEEVAAWIVLNSSSVAELTERRLFEPGVAQVIAAVSEVTRLFHLEG